MGGVAYGVTRLFGTNNALGPIVVLVLLLAGLAYAFSRRFRSPAPPTIAGAEA
jgi:hypothetical protein